MLPFRIATERGNSEKLNGCYFAQNKSEVGRFVPEKVQLKGGLR